MKNYPGFVDKHSRFILIVLIINEERMINIEDRESGKKRDFEN